MNIATLLSGLDYNTIQGTEDKEVSDIIYNSKKCKKGCLFFALYGRDYDGKKYIDDAIFHGAAAVVFQNKDAYILQLVKKWSAKKITFVQTVDARKALAAASKIFWNCPDEELLTIGVTGTKGKTTTTHMIKKILEDAGVKTGIIGTIKNGYEGHYEEGNNTTPESYEVYRMMRDMADNGCKAVTMEVSSQGLKYSRVDGICFDFGLITNLSPDHIGIGEHTDFDDYFYSKKKLFQMCKAAVVNANDAFCREMTEGTSATKVIYYGIGGDAAYEITRCDIIDSDGVLGIECDCKAGDSKWHATIPLPGKYNAYNSISAMAVCCEIGVDPMEAARSLSSISIRGRSERVETPEKGKYNIIIDYAHNGMSLAHLLKTLREYAPKRLIVVFGCGGERARSRRYDMGKVASTYADYCIVTSDNPRNEDPISIIEDIVRTMQDTTCRYRVIENRKEAIEYAVKQAEPGDTIVISGKGHETYQIIGNEKKHFDDREVILQILDNKSV